MLSASSRPTGKILWPEPPSWPTTSRTVVREDSSFAVVITPSGLFSIRYRCDAGGLMGLPSTVTRSWSGSITIPDAGGRSPLTRTEPEAINASDARRLATPARAR